MYSLQMKNGFLKGAMLKYIVYGTHCFHKLIKDK